MKVHLGLLKSQKDTYHYGAITGVGSRTKLYVTIIGSAFSCYPSSQRATL